MKKILLFLLTVIFINSLCFATIRRVGFFGPAVPNVDYATLQLAHDAASAGDTIMMMPNSLVEGNISKQLLIIGPGYFLDATNNSRPGNAGLQANVYSTLTGGNLDFKAGSSNTQIIGCYLGLSRFVDAGLAGIIFKRCYLNNGIQINANTDSPTFQQCNFFNSLTASSSGTFSVTNLTVSNCIFDATGISFGSNVTASGIFSNCIFYSTSLSFIKGSCLIQNCISNSSFTGNNIVYNNNIGTGTQFPAGNGNQQNKSWASIFTLTGSYDGKYTLAAGSPAIGAGLNGLVATDCGVFGGATPYRLSGIPTVPTIYALTSPQGTLPAGNSVQINMSTRTNN